MSLSGSSPHGGIEHLPSIPMDYLAQLILNLPFPILCVVMSIAFVLLMALWIFGLYILFFVAALLGLDFLITPIDQLVAPSSQAKLRRPKAKSSQNYQLQNRLLTLLKGDVRTAKRLLVQARRKHPGKTDNWYLEKVIWDLQRDRH